jgi:hypothetical protein
MAPILTRSHHLSHPWNGTPFPLLAVMFAAPVIVLFLSGTNGGWSYFVNNDASIFLIALGMLAFNSVFFAFVLKDARPMLTTFNSEMDKASMRLREDFIQQLRRYTVTNSQVNDFQGFDQAIKEYRFFVSPTLWFYLSILCFMTVVGVTIGSFSGKPYLAFGLVYAGLLFSFWMIFSLFSLHITEAYVSLKQTPSSHKR